MNTLPPTAHTLQFGETEIRFSLNYADRKTLAIHVYPDGQVGVDAPLSTDIEKVYGKVKKRASWILKQQRQFECYPAPLPERCYVSGETHRYLGRQYRLKVTEGLGEAVKLTRGMLQVETHSPQDSLRVQRLLQAWYRSKALTVFAERYAQCIQRVERLGIHHNKGFQLRFMSKRWGSCTGKGIITLNPELIAAPKDCIDYVIIHELCHLKEHNHSQAFYRLLASVMNDWELRRKLLNEMVEVRFV
ncbi:MAG: SprT family zinc-dependent metalloprotease [Methylobacter sp.]|nr:SprT family zinc-dependent metalloprotease [Methylobacter sp.]